MIQHSQPITPLGHLLVLALVIPINVTPGLLEKGHRVTLAVEQVHYPLVQSLFGPMGNKFGDRFVFVGLDGDIESLQKTVQWQEQVAKRDAYSLMTAIRVSNESTVQLQMAGNRASLTNAIYGFSCAPSGS